MYKKFFYLLTFILVGLVGCEKADTTSEVLPNYSEENLRKSTMYTSGLCCDEDIPIILDIDSTPIAGEIWNHSCNYDITSLDWAITNSNNSNLASGSGMNYSSLFLPSHNEVYTLSIEAIMVASTGLSKTEVANFSFKYHKNGSFNPFGSTREISLNCGLTPTISAFAP